MWVISQLDGFRKSKIKKLSNRRSLVKGVIEEITKTKASLENLTKVGRPVQMEDVKSFEKLKSNLEKSASMAKSILKKPLARYKSKLTEPLGGLEVTVATL